MTLNIKRLFSCLIIILTSRFSFSQCPITVSATPATSTICSGSSVNLSASSSGAGTTFSWSPSTGLSSVNVSNPTASPITTTTYTVTGILANGVNTVVNGGFESGNTGFSSQYNGNPTSGTWGLLSTEGTYAISSSASNVHTNFANFPDHTPGGGTQYMIVNGATGSGTKVWCETMAVTPGQTYVFSCWVSNVWNTTNPTEIASLNFDINGINIGTNFSPIIGNPQWIQYTTSWVCPIGTTSITLCVENTNLLVSGNDFALDDISFQTACTSTSTVTVNVINPTASNNGPICSGQNVNLSSAAIPGATYSWSGPSGFSANTQNATVSGITASGTYTVNVTLNGVTCPTTTNVTINPNPTASITAISPICIGQSVTLSGSVSGPINTTVTVSNTTPIGIPDGGIASSWTGAGGTYATSNMNVTGLNTNWQLTSIVLNIAHTWDGDAIVYLFDPCGNSIALINANGGSGDNFTNTTFTPGAGTAISAGTPPFTGTFIPAGGAAAWSAFITASQGCGSANGTWSIHAGDYVGADAGTLNNWTLNFSNPNNTTFVWSPTTNMTNSNTLTPTITPTVAGTTTYTLTATNTYGCIATSTIDVVASPLATANANIDQTICVGGTVTLAGSVGGSATTGTWTAPTGSFSNATNLNSTYTPTILSGSVILTLTTNDPAGSCTVITDQMTITVTSPPTPNAGLDQSICAGASVTIGNDPVWTQEGASYSWSNGAGSGTLDLSGGGQNHGTVSVTPAITTTYTLTVTSLSNCSATDQVTVTLDTPPTASNPGPLSVACTSNIPAPNITVVTTEADDFTIPPIVTWISDVSNGGTCPNVVTRTYRVTDGCGNFVNVTQTITAGATSTVVMPPAGASTVACPALAVAPTVPVVLDNCGRTLAVSAPVISAAPACSGTQTYTYTYTSCSGTTYPWVYTYTISAPTVSMPAAGGTTVACPALAVAPTVPVVLDNCGRTLTVSAPVISAAPTCSGTQTYTYTYTSCSGTTYPWVYTYTISAPTVSMPAAGASTVACPALAVAPTVPVVLDNCGRTLTVSAPVVSAAPACSGTQTYTYTFTSCSGTTYPWVYTYTISAPTVSIAPAGASTVACPALAVAPTVPVVLDNCGRTLTVSAPVVSAAPACSGTQTYTYTYTSCSGTTYPWVYTYTISAPTVSIPPAGASTVACPALAVAPTVPVVLDNCGRTLTVSAPVVSAAPACSGTQTYTYTYTSCSGTTYPWVYTYTISAPTVSIPPAGASTVACPALAVAPTVPVVLDNCGRTLTVSAPVISAAPACSGTQTYTYTYTSCSGTTYPWVYTYTINDNVLPTASNPTAISVAGGVAPAPDVLVVTNEEDNCSTPTVLWVSDISDNGVCPETITRTYSVTDACLNQILVIQLITIGDAVLPTASNPATVTVDCIGNLPVQNPSVVIDEADNGATPTVTWESDVSNNGACPEIIARTYRVTDDCGNFIFVTQTITVLDVTDPVFAATPSALTVACPTDVPAMTNLAYTDNCDPAGSVAGTDVSDGNTCPETITRTWTFTDACGNNVTTSQTITVHDLVAPVFAMAPAALTVACPTDVPAMTTLAYTDNCDPAGSVAGTDASDGNTCPETITRTWTFTDVCGNNTTATQTITVHDLVAPVFAATPAAVTVSCIADVPAMTNLAYTDNCDVAGSVAGTDGALIGGACGGTITRTWTITDLCGNTSTATQIITVDDNTPPTASNPAAVSVASTAIVPIPNILVVTDEADNCNVPTIAWVSDVSDGNICNLEQITRTYSVTDACGNQIFVTQLITILAVYPPINAGPDHSICFGDTVTLTADNPLNALISWDNGIVNGGSFNPTNTITYTVTANNFGCIATDQVLVQVNMPEVVNFVPDVTAGCLPLTVNFINTTPNSLNGVWSLNNGTVLNGIGSVSNTFTQSGCFDVTLTVTSTNGCVSSATFADLICIDPDPVAAFSTSSNILTTLDTEALFNNNSTGASEYTWNFGDSTALSVEDSPIHSYPEEAGGYEVMLIATSPAGCADTAYGIIQINEELLFYVPNTFTPDGNNYNQTFQPVFSSGFDPYDFTLLIFNRWGEIIFESHNAEIGWDGTYGSNGETGLVQDGTYTWKIEFKIPHNDERKVVIGHVNVIR